MLTLSLNYEAKNSSGGITLEGRIHDKWWPLLPSFHMTLEESSYSPLRMTLDRPYHPTSTYTTCWTLLPIPTFSTWRAYHSPLHASLDGVICHIMFYHCTFNNKIKLIYAFFLYLCSCLYLQKYLIWHFRYEIIFRVYRSKHRYLCFYEICQIIFIILPRQTFHYKGATLVKWSVWQTILSKLWHTSWHQSSTMILALELKVAVLIWSFK